MHPVKIPTSMQQSALLLLGLLLTGFFALPVRGQEATETNAPLEDLDAYVEQVRSHFDVPGIALAVVKDGNVVVAKGYGVRAMNQPERVDAGTLFAIGSNTKAFTATALGLLAEQGKLEWDAPVIRYLPGFQLSDPYVTREITVRDLLVHRSGLGLGQGDLLFWPPTTYDRAEVVRRLRHLSLQTSFRSAYAYDNVLYLVAGELIEAVSGQPWEDFVTSHIFDPVGMNESTTRMADGLASANAAQPHAPVEGAVRRIETFTFQNAGPAGGIFASAHDMAKWLTVQLDSGRVAPGTRLISPQTTQELWAPVTPLAIGNPPPDLAVLKPQFNGYALGFGVRDYRGHKVVSHTGGLPGFVSQVMMVPGLKLGIVVLTNQESGLAFNAITYHIVDQYLGASDTDWLPILQSLQARSQAQGAAAEQEIEANRDSTSGPSLPPSAYAGPYTDAWYGAITITEEDEGLVMRFSHTPLLIGDVAHWQHDTFVVRWRDRTLRADAFVTFALNPDGSIDQAKMQPVSPATDFSYDFHDLLLKPDRRGK